MKHTIHRRVLDYAYTGTDVLFRDFQLSEDGYSEEQVEKSRGRYGENVLSGSASDSVRHRLRRAFVNPFSIILFVLASISAATIQVHEAPSATLTPVITSGRDVGTAIFMSIWKSEAPNVCPTQRCTSLVCLMPV